MEFVDLCSFCKWVLFDFIGSNGIWGFCVDKLKLVFPMGVLFILFFEFGFGFSWIIELSIFRPCLVGKETEWKGKERK
jgi:hypothetical protein